MVFVVFVMGTFKRATKGEKLTVDQMYSSFMNERLKATKGFLKETNDVRLKAVVCFGVAVTNKVEKTEGKTNLSKLFVDLADDRGHVTTTVDTGVSAQFMSRARIAAGKT